MSRPQPSPRRLTRSRNDRMIGGVCGGIAEYLNMDPTLVRVLVVVIALVTAALPVVVVYLILMAVIPEAQPTPPPPVGPAHPQGYQPGQPYQQTDPVWGSQGAPWQQPAAPPTAQPRQSAEDLFSRAKQPGQPSGPATDQGFDPPNASGPDDAAPGADSPSRGDDG